jgi:hypothetical protein
MPLQDDTNQSPCLKTLAEQEVHKSDNDNDEVDVDLSMTPVE